MWSKRILIGMLATVAAFTILMTITGDAQAQNGRADIIVVVHETRVVVGENLSAKAIAVRGTGTFVDFIGKPNIMLLSADNQNSRELACWQWAQESWIEIDTTNTQFPDACFRTPNGNQPADDNIYAFDFQVPPPCPQSVCNPQGTNAYSEPRNYSIFVNGTLPSQILEEDNIIMSGYDQVIAVDEKDQLFGHQANPLQVDTFSGSQTTFIILAFLGLILAAIKGWVFPAFAAFIGLGHPIFENAGVDYPIDFTFVVLLYAIGIVLHMALARFGSQHRGEGGLIR